MSHLRGFAHSFVWMKFFYHSLGLFFIPFAVNVSDLRKRKALARESRAVPLKEPPWKAGPINAYCFLKRPQSVLPRNCQG